LDHQSSQVLYYDIGAIINITNGSDRASFVAKLINNQVLEK
jgi:hypothetical protein